MKEAQSRLISELRQFSVCQVMDALGNSCAIETSIRPIDSQFRIGGIAFTVECAPADNLTLHHALHLAQPGDVLVVSSPGPCEVALWGELMSVSALSKGLAGTIVDGPIRDPLEIRTLGYPVFCREFRPARAKKENYGHINVPIRVGTLSISPQDVILADANGIVCIQRGQAQEVAQLASEIMHKENIIKEQIRAGRTIFDALSLQQYVSEPRR